MAKFLQVKEKLFNLDNVDYIDTDHGEEHGVRIFFNGLAPWISAAKAPSS